MLSLNQIVQTLNDLQTASSQLGNGSFLFGTPAEWGADAKITYPLMGVRLVSSDINGTILNTSLNIFFADLIHKSGFQGNETEVLSDMQRAALRMYSEIKNELETNYPATLELTSSITPFYEGSDDEVSGVEMNINITQFFDRSVCA